MSRPVRIVVTIVAAIVLVGGGFFAIASSDAAPDWMRFWQDDEPAFNGGYFTPPRELHELTNAVDQNGEPFSFSDHAGKTIFVYFGYTHCPDACPATLAEWREVRAELGDDADNVVFVMITVDPERDTPERLKEWLGFWDPTFYGVSLPREDTDAVIAQWGITATRRESDSASGYLVDHSVETYVVDPQGQVRLTYPLGFDPADIAEDIRLLISGK